MRKLILITGIIITCFVFSSCIGNRYPDPEDAAGDFIDLWLEQDFDSMQPMLSNEAKENFPKKTFISRNEKIYNDIDVSKLQINAEPLTKEELRAAKKNGKTSIQLSIAFNTIAGKVDFDKDMELHLKKTDNEMNWKVNWNEGLILPGLEDGGKVSIQHIEPRRGEILDRNKMPLALNDVAYKIGVTPQDFVDETEEKEHLSDLLNISIDSINEDLSAEWVQDDFFVPLSTIPAKKETLFNELKQIPSVSYTETSGRTYPLGEAAAHLTGYVGQITQAELKEHPEGNYKENDFIGKIGLEKMYEKQLRGKEGVQINILTESGTDSTEVKLVAEKPAQNGEHVRLTIDINVQEKVYQTYEGRSGTSAVLHPKTGEVLALVSSPAYNPDELTYGITQNRWNELMENDSKPFTNRFTATYAPGSSIKPITAAVGLANDSINFKDGVEINGLTWGKEEWNGKKVTRVSTSEKPVTLEDALVRSDNIYFAMKAVDMGNKKFIKGMKNFGFEEKLPFEFPVERSQISNDGKLDEILLANTSYGQGEIEMSALHVALAYTPFLNDGNMLKPSLLLDNKKSTVWKKDLITEKQADTIKEYLSKVVSEGTAKSAKDENLQISGKTGTAELKLAKGTTGRQNGWFVGYPTENEDYLVAMMIEDVGDVGSSSYVAGKVKDVLKAIK